MKTKLSIFAVLFLSILSLGSCHHKEIPNNKIDTVKKVDTVKINGEFLDVYYIPKGMDNFVKRKEEIKLAMASKGHKFLNEDPQKGVLWFQLKENSYLFSRCFYRYTNDTMSSYALLEVGSYVKIKDELYKYIAETLGFNTAVQSTDFNLLETKKPQLIYIGLHNNQKWGVKLFMRHQVGQDGKTQEALMLQINKLPNT